jgi:Ferredoxin
MASPYAILDVSESADADEIRTAYRSKIKGAHPDRGGSIEEFVLVKEAYEEAMHVLQSPDHNPADVTYRAAREPVGYTVSYLDYAVVQREGWAVDDPQNFSRAEGLELHPREFGAFAVEHRESVLEAAERHGFSWPYSCRGGACANCAILVVEGAVDMNVNTVLTRPMREQGIRLSCIGEPVTEHIAIVFDIGSLPGLSELRLPAQQVNPAE